jgi:hypothetical protein
VDKIKRQWYIPALIDHPRKYSPLIMLRVSMLRCLVSSSHERLKHYRDEFKRMSDHYYKIEWSTVMNDHDTLTELKCVLRNAIALIDMIECSRESDIGTFDRAKSSIESIVPSDPAEVKRHHGWSVWKEQESRFIFLLETYDRDIVRYIRFKKRVRAFLRDIGC